MRSPSSQSCKSVLIVNDNPWIRKVLCERFQREADLVVCGEAENGKEAIEKAQQLRPELIVLDLSMRDERTGRGPNTEVAAALSATHYVQRVRGQAHRAASSFDRHTRIGSKV